jgi:hypothetical protein
MNNARIAKVTDRMPQMGREEFRGDCVMCITLFTLSVSAEKMDRFETDGLKRQ